MSQRMKRLSVKKQEREQRRQNLGDEYEESSQSDISSNINRDSRRQIEEEKMNYGEIGESPSQKSSKRSPSPG